jgi:hypothetical protein
VNPFYVARRATATVWLQAAVAMDSAAKVPAEVGLASAVAESLALCSDKRIVSTAEVCRKPDKREQSRPQNPNPSDTRKRDRVKTT